MKRTNRRDMKKPLTLIACLMSAGLAPLAAQVPVAEQKPASKAWYEKLSLRGYVQLRYNRILENNEELRCDSCDRSLGSNQGIFARRARLIVSGDVHERVYIYFQPDFAASAGTTNNVAQLRDLYADIALDEAKESRIRAGQSKVPYGFENLQSSQNRLALDRNDALNSAVANERDMGAFYYWAPAHIRKRLSHLVSSGLKGSGDYGVFGIGLYNGQTANRPEANDNLHAVARLAYPFEVAEERFVEAGVQGYMGKYVVTSDQRTAAVGGGTEFDDRRMAVSAIVYPQPLGFQAEWNFGEGPEYDSTSNTIQEKPLRGGYVQTMYMWKHDPHVVTPFVRAQYYQGGKKNETDARRYLVRELELGSEWQMNKYLELTALYSIEDRTYQDGSSAANRGNRQKGERGRVQLQFNF